MIGVGRVVAQKDPQTWIAAATLACEKHPEATFDWWGPSHLENQWDSLVARHSSLSGAVRFRGPTQDVAPLLRSASVFFHTAHREAHSIALLEAAASGIPIVCTSAVGRTLPPWIGRDEFEAGDELGAASALSSMISDYAVRHRSAMESATRVHEEFGISAAAARYANLIEEVLFNSQRSSRGN